MKKLVILLAFTLFSLALLPSIFSDGEIYLDCRNLTTQCTENHKGLNLLNDSDNSGGSITHFTGNGSIYLTGAGLNPPVINFSLNGSGIPLTGTTSIRLKVRITRITGDAGSENFMTLTRVSSPVGSGDTIMVIEDSGSQNYGIEQVDSLDPSPTLMSPPLIPKFSTALRFQFSFNQTNHNMSFFNETSPGVYTYIDSYRSTRFTPSSTPAKAWYLPDGEGINDDNGDSDMDFWIDEILIFNGTVPVFPAAEDTTIPTIVTGINSSTSTVELGAVLNITGNLTDETAMQTGNITYNMTPDGTVRILNFTGLSGLTVTIINITIADTIGFFNFSFYAEDSSANNNQADQTITVVDTVIPSLFFGVNITNAFIGDVINISLNTSDFANINVVNITYNISGSITSVNFTGLSGNSHDLHNVTRLPERGFINITAYTLDENGNLNSTSITIEVQDNLIPSLQGAINNTSPKIGDTINISGNFTDETGLLFGNITYNQSGSVTKVNFTLSGTSQNIFNITNITTIKGNVINFSIYVTDTSNNVNQTDFLVTVANTPPETPVFTNETKKLKICACIKIGYV